MALLNPEFPGSFIDLGVVSGGKDATTRPITYGRRTSLARRFPEVTSAIAATLVLLTLGGAAPTAKDTSQTSETSGSVQLTPDTRSPHHRWNVPAEVDGRHAALVRRAAR